MLLSLKLLLLFLSISEQVIDKDILNIHWDTMNSPPNHGLYHHRFKSSPRRVRKLNLTTIKQDNNHHYQNDNDNDDRLESEFGIFVDSDDIIDKNNRKKKRNHRPQQQTLNSNKIVQNSTKNDDNSVKKRINRLMKDYLSRLYIQKYNNNTDNKQIDPDFLIDNSTPNGKFIGDNIDKNNTILQQLKNKTLTLIDKFKQFLSVITVIQFDNNQCETTINNINYIGTCFTQSMCDNLNGTNGGTCANGYGICCIFRGTCDGSSSQNCTYFENPGYPNYDPPETNVTISPITSSTTTENPSPTPDPRLRFFHYRYKRQIDTQFICRFAVFKTNRDVKQMRIDFLDFDLTGPTNGTCMDERLIIQGQNVNDQIPIICGYNTGQHIYVDVTMLTGALTLSVLSATGQPKRFRLRICQIIGDTCTNSYNCLQYYTGVNGVISSFNYDQTAIYSRSTPGYLNNLNYAICIRKEAGYCTITFTNAANSIEYPFQFVNVDENGNQIVPSDQAGVDISNCPDDYIIIGGTRLCGDRLNDGTILDDFTRNAPVTDTSAGPIVVQVRTNEAINGRGFKLFYMQNRCPST